MANLNIKKLFTHTLNEITDVKENLSELETDISNGNFPEMAVGSADQLISDNYVVENEPYQFRRSGGSADIGTRMEDAIVGGSIVWNQLVPKYNSTYTDNGISINGDGTGKVTIIVSTATGYCQKTIGTLPVTEGHKYLSLRGTAYDTISLYFTGMSGGNHDKIFVADSSGNKNINIYVYSTIGDGTYACHPMLIDLTAMFGSTIADYIYSLEQANQGAGVAFFKKFFPNDYYAYNAGELISVSGLSEHKTVGFNLWDEEWEVGDIDDNGQPISGNKRIRSKNYIPILPSTTLYIGFINVYLSGTWYTVRYYDKNKNYLSATSPNKNTSFVTPNNAYYMKFSTSDSWGQGVKYEGGINVNISDPAKNGTYEPYKVHSYPLDDSLTLRGIPKLDSNNQLYFDGDKYDSDGFVTRRGQEVTITIDNIYVREDNPICDFAIFTVPMRWFTALIVLGEKVFSSMLRFDTETETGGILPYSSNSRQLAVAVPKGYTKAQAETLFNGSKLVYIVETTTTEEAEPYHNPQILSPEGTEEYVSTSLVPVGHETKYFEDLKSKIEGLPKDFSTLIAPTEATYTATRNYTTGQLLIVNNILYKATSNIANGGTITLNTNVLATTLSEVIASLS